MTDVMERLRAANPTPNCPPPPIEDVWRRIDTDNPIEQYGGSAPRPRKPLALARLSNAVALAASVAVVIAVVAIVVVGHGQTTPKSRPQPTTETVPQVPSSHASVKIDPAVASEFSVLRSPAKADDALPAAFEGALSNYRRFGPEPGGARRVTASNGETAYLVPAKQGACVVTSFAAAILPGAYSMDLCSPTLPPGQIELQWLIPDGATNVTIRTANGVAATLASGYNVYIANIRTKTIREVNRLGSKRPAPFRQPRRWWAGRQMHASQRLPASIEAAESSSRVRHDHRNNHDRDRPRRCNRRQTVIVRSRFQ